MATHYPNQTQTIDAIEEEINRFFDRIVECVDFRRRTLIAEAREKKEEKRAKLVEKQESERQLLEAKDDTERNMKENILQETKKGILANIEEKLSEVRLQEAETRLVFQGDSGQLEEMILGLGVILEQEIPAIPRYQDLKVSVAVGRQGLGNGKISYAHAIAIHENTHNIYIAQGTPSSTENTRISVFSETGEFLNSFGQEHLKVPRGIAIHGNDVFVTDWATNRVYQFKQSEDNHLITSAGGEGSENGKFKGPTQVCLSMNGNIYVTDYMNDRVQTLDSSFQFLLSISHLSMTRPYDVKLTKNEVYVLSTKDSHCIHVFKHTGEKIRSLIPPRYEKQVIGAQNFCLDANNNIIISDRAVHCIRVFSNEGTLQHTISEWGDEKGKLVSPHGIALTKDLKLVVVSWNENYGLQIFS